MTNNPERAVICSVLLDGKSLDRILDFLSPKNFNDPVCVTIYQSMIDLNLEDSAIDLTTVGAKSKTDLSTLAEIMQETPTSTNIVSYAKLVKQAYGLRKLEELQVIMKPRIEKAEEGLISVYKKELDEIEKELNISIDFDQTGMEAILNKANEARANRKNGKIEGFKTGLPTLDKLLRGQLKGKFIAIAGYNSFGKSSLAINLCQNACEDGANAMFFSLEMGQEEIINRILPIASGIENRHFIYPTEVSIGLAYDKVMKYKLNIIDSLDDVDKIISLIKEQKAKGRCDVVYLDYMQNLTSSTYPERTKMLEYSAKRFRLLALQENICIVALNQISEDAIKNKNQFSSGIKGSGDVSSASDVTIAIHREKNDSGFTDKYGIEIKKHRYGRVGFISCKISPKTLKITEVTNHYE